MDINWFELPEGLELRIRASDNGAIPYIQATNERLFAQNNWLAKLFDFPGEVYFNAESGQLSFKDLLNLPNAFAFAAVLGPDAKASMIPARLVFDDLAAVEQARNFFPDGLYEAMEQQFAAEAQVVGLHSKEPSPLTSAGATQELSSDDGETTPSDTELSDDSGVADTTLVDQPSLEQNESSSDVWPWLNLKPFGIRLILSETNSAYRENGGADYIPMLSGEPLIIDHFRSRIESLGGIFTDTGQVFWHALDEVPTLEQWQSVGFDLTEIEPIPVDEVFVSIDENSRGALHPVIDFQTLDFTPLTDRVSEDLKDYALSLIVSNERYDNLNLLDYSNPHYLSGLVFETFGIHPELHQQQLTGFSSRRVQEAIEAAGVNAFRLIRQEIEGNLIGYGFESQSEALDVIKTLEDEVLAKLPKMDARNAKSQELQQFSTPLGVSRSVQDLLQMGDIHAGSKLSVWEPTIGNGSLVAQVDPSRIYGMEIDADRVKQIHHQGATHVIHGDAIEAEPPKNAHDIVVMNPPFGGFTDKKSRLYQSPLNKNAAITINRQDHWIALKHLEAMKPDGRAFLILGAEHPMRYRDGELGEAALRFRRFLNDNYNVVGEAWLSGGLFKSQGASWPLHVIAIHGRHAELQDVDINDSLRTVHDESQLTRLFKEWSSSLEMPGSEAEQSLKQEVDPEPEEDTEEQEPEPELTPPTDMPEALKPDVSASASDSNDVSGASGEKTETLVDPDESLSEYIPLSKGLASAKKVPSNLAGPIQDSLQIFHETYGDIDKFVCLEMDWAHDELMDRLSAEQIDALGMSIAQIKSGGGFVMGDYTGVGKGRVVASLIAWGVKQGLNPVFLTEKKGLFHDMARDLVDINEIDTIKPLITNSDVHVVADENFEPPRTLFRSTPDSELNKILDSNGEIGSYNCVFTTYSQFAKAAGRSKKAAWLPAIANNNLLILDESHNAAGLDSNTGLNLRAAIQGCKGVLYSSATYAKRPDNLALYMKTSMFKGASVDSVIESIQRGGVAFNESLSVMLAKSGQYISRTHDKIYTPEMTLLDDRIPDHEEATVRELMDKMSRIYELFNVLSNETQEWVRSKNEEEKEALSGEGVTNWSSATVSFGSRMWRFDETFRFILKSFFTLSKTLERVANGKQVVLAADNTMESFLEDMQEQAVGAYLRNQSTDESVIDPLETAVDVSFKNYMLNFLPRLLLYKTRTDKYGNDTPEEIAIWDVEKYRAAHDDGTLNQMLHNPDLSPDEKDEIRTAFKYFKAESYINELPDWLPASPIDWMKAKLADAGVNMGEITSRKIGIDYTNPSHPRFYQRSKANMDKKAAEDRFNNGDDQVILINRSGSTGISLHASKVFKCQKDRSMLIWQSFLDPIQVVQMMGRIYRTNMVDDSIPEYQLLSLPLIGETRSITSLIRKLESMNANTRGDRQTNMETADIFNGIGDLVVLRVLQSLPDGDRIAQLCNISLSQEQDCQRNRDLIGVNTGLAKKFTGRMLALPVEIGEAIFSEIEQKFEEVIEELESLGENPLKLKVFDWYSSTLDRIELSPPCGLSAFEDGVYARKIQYKHRLPPVDINHLTYDMLTAIEYAETKGAQEGFINHHRENISRLMLKNAQERLILAFKGKNFADWNSPDQITFLRNLMSNNDSATMLRRAAQIYGRKNNGDTMTKAQEKSLEHMAQVLQQTNIFIERSKDLNIGSVIHNLPIDDPNISEGAGTFFITNIMPPESAEKLAQLGKWRIQLRSTNPVVGTVNLSLNKLINMLGEGATVNGSVLSSGRPDKEVLNHFLDSSDQPSSIIMTRWVLDGNLFRAYEAAREHGAGSPGVYTDENGVKNRGIIMPTHFDETNLDNMMNARFIISTPRSVVEYLEDLPDRASSTPHGIMSTDAFSTTFAKVGKNKTPVGSYDKPLPSKGIYIDMRYGQPALIISSAKTNNKAFVGDKTLNSMLATPFEHMNDNRQCFISYLSYDKKLEDLVKHLSNHHGLSFVGEAVMAEWHRDYQRKLYDEAKAELESSKNQPTEQRIGPACAL